MSVLTPKFRRAYEFTTSAAIEGGFSDIREDRGGRTMNGFTQRLYDGWRFTHGLPKRDVRLIEEEEKEQIAHDEFWVPAQCEPLPEPLCIAVFDMAFNSGPWNAKLTLQRALRVKQDGVIGEKTVRAAQDPEAMLRFLMKRAAFIQDIVLNDRSQVIFLEGWINRLLLLQAWRP